MNFLKSYIFPFYLKAVLLSALDAKIRLSLRYLIKEVQQKLKITTIFVTHDQEEALSLSDRIFVMKKGSLVQTGTPEDIYRHPANNFVASFIGTYNFFKPAFLNVWEDRNHILVRPEHIKILDGKYEVSGKDVYEGTISSVYFLSNIIRLIVSVEGSNLIVDTLNRDGNNFRLDQPITLRIPEKRYIRLA
jgi:putative spermidine/putrescine transport system ATP-binding protein